MTAVEGELPRLPDAHIIPGEHGGFKVRPAVAVVRRADGFRIRNLTRYAAWIQLPDAVLSEDAGREEREAVLLKIFPKNVAALLARARWVNPDDYTDFVFSDTAVGLVEYRVAVFPMDGAVPADGESPPKIIIEP